MSARMPLLSRFSALLSSFHPHPPLFRRFTFSPPSFPAYSRASLSPLSAYLYARFHRFSSPSRPSRSPSRVSGFCARYDATERENSAAVLVQRGASNLATLRVINFENFKEDLQRRLERLCQESLPSFQSVCRGASNPWKYNSQPLRDI